MPRGQAEVSKVHYQGTEEDFIVFVDSPEDLEKWKSDRSIPLSSVVNSFKIFITHKSVLSISQYYCKAILTLLQARSPGNPRRSVQSHSWERVRHQERGWSYHQDSRIRQSSGCWGTRLLQAMVEDKITDWYIEQLEASWTRRRPKRVTRCKTGSLEHSFEICIANMQAANELQDWGNKMSYWWPRGLAQYYNMVGSPALCWSIVWKSRHTFHTLLPMNALDVTVKESHLCFCSMAILRAMIFLQNKSHTTKETARYWMTLPAAEQDTHTIEWPLAHLQDAKSWSQFSISLADTPAKTLTYRDNGEVTSRTIV